MTTRQSLTQRMPVLFIGHGSPMNAVEQNEFTNSWKALAKKIPRPKLILCISAHWLTNGTFVTSMSNPKTIHDFYGFPKRLYDIQYQARGSKEASELIKDAVRTVSVQSDLNWGLDHGTWSVLVNMYPKADVPVLQLSLDATLPLEKHFGIGRELTRLREKGVLIIGSGNIVHNLGMMNSDPEAKPYAWAVAFDAFVKENLAKKDSDALIKYGLQKSSASAVPTNEHYLPLLYVMGASDHEAPQFLCEQIFSASLSMRCVLYENS